MTFLIELAKEGGRTLLTDTLITPFLLSVKILPRNVKDTKSHFYFFTESCHVHLERRFFLNLLNTHLAKAFLLLISFWEEAEVVLKLLLKPKYES